MAGQLHQSTKSATQSQNAYQQPSWSFHSSGHRILQNSSTITGIEAGQAEAEDLRIHRRQSPSTETSSIPLLPQLPFPNPSLYTSQINNGNRKSTGPVNSVSSFLVGSPGFGGVNSGDIGNLSLATRKSISDVFSRLVACNSVRILPTSLMSGLSSNTPNNGNSHERNQNQNNTSNPNSNQILDHLNGPSSNRNQDQSYNLSRSHNERRFALQDNLLLRIRRLQQLPRLRSSQRYLLLCYERRRIWPGNT
ncbi:unnamed protein product [Protopolystoma xenopodis]|uniref:Uncharacterized protein n=1 Tax=Protopolystoma xenopodis TaxID=117903 RepID=A0A3S5CDC0_9PLAT|nr:unnamed protein product [Protopolystoma xenopodis]